jgi:hypothetical protein
MTIGDAAIAKLKLTSSWGRMAHLSLLLLLCGLGVPAIAHATLPSIAQLLPTQIDPVLQKLQGQWQRTTTPELKYPEFKYTETFVFAPGGKLFFLGIGSEVETFAIQYTYTINSVPRPMHLDVTFPGTGDRAQTIFDFTPDGNLRLQLSLGNLGVPRPTTFTDKNPPFQKLSDFPSLRPDLNRAMTQVGMEEMGESEGRRFMALLNQAQIAYHLENGRFADLPVQFGINTPLETTHYRYQIERSGDASERIKLVGRAKRSGLKSFSAAVFSIKLDNRWDILLARVCETFRPSLFAPAMPKLTGTPETWSIQCPPGSSPV